MKILKNMITFKTRELRDFEINQNELLNNVDILNRMNDFLKGSYVTENVEFLLMAKKLCEISEMPLEELKSKIENIKHDYFSNSSTKQLNVDAKTAKAFKECNITQLDDVKKFLKPVMDAIRYEMSVDTLGRFLSDSTQREYIYKTFKSSGNILIPKNIIQLKDSNLIDCHYVEDSTFDLAYKLQNDYIGWDLSYTSGTFSGFFMSGNYVMGSDYMKKSITCKFQKTFDHSLEHVIMKMMPNYSRLKYEKTFIKWSCEKYNTIDDLKNMGYSHASRPCMDSLFVAKLASILTRRTVRTCVSAKVIGKSIYFVKQPLILKNAKPYKYTRHTYTNDRTGKIETVKTLPILNFFIEVYEPISDHKTKFTQIHTAEFGGWLKGKFGKKAFELRCKELDKTLGDYIGEGPILTYDKPKLSNDGYGKLFLFLGLI